MVELDNSVSVLFSEPKIPQSRAVCPLPSPPRASFSALQRAENSSIRAVYYKRSYNHNVSVLFSEPKIPQYQAALGIGDVRDVSVLFSEPKIPQSQLLTEVRFREGRFSALQRAENSSIHQRQTAGTRRAIVSVLFSEPKIPQSPETNCRNSSRDCFSALQRAENSSIQHDARQRKQRVEVSVLFSEPKIPQFTAGQTRDRQRPRVSVLFSEPKIPQSISYSCAMSEWDAFQCSSASRKFLNFPQSAGCDWSRAVSVLFSEPKIPQSVGSILSRRRSTEFQCSSASRKFLNRPTSYVCARIGAVSVLFSEPKIPQSWLPSTSAPEMRGFSALQRAENSSIILRCRQRVERLEFQCSSASRKFLNRTSRPSARACMMVSVLFSEPKIPQLETLALHLDDATLFQCSSASRKFLNSSAPPAGAPAARVSVLFSEPKIPQSRPSHLRPSIFPTAMITLRHS